MNFPEARGRWTCNDSEALAARLGERDLDLIRACELANQDPEVTEIEKEFDGIPDEMPEPWN